MNDNLRVEVQISNYIKDDYGRDSVTIRSALFDDDMVVIETNTPIKVKASELIKAAQLCSHNRW